MNHKLTRLGSSRTLLMCAAALALTFAAVGCSNTNETNEGSRPSIAEIQVGMEEIMKSDGIVTEEDLNTDQGKEALKCMSTGIHKEDKIPNEVVRAVAKGEDPTIDEKNEGEYEGILTEIAKDCYAQVSP